LRLAHLLGIFCYDHGAKEFVYPINVFEYDTVVAVLANIVGKRFLADILLP